MRTWTRDHRFWYRVVGQGAGRLVLQVEEPTPLLCSTFRWEVLAYGGDHLPDIGKVVKDDCDTLAAAKKAVAEAAEGCAAVIIGQEQLFGEEVSP